MHPLVFVVCAITTLSNAHSDLLRFKEYQFTFTLPNNNALRRLIDAENTFSCTDTVPFILQKLCVRFAPNNDFQYKFQSEPDFSSYANTDDDIISTNDDSNWNEFSYGQPSSSLSSNNGRSSHQYMKKCRYSNERRECVHYDAPSNAVTLGIKIPTDRTPRDSIHFADILPANIYNNDPLRNPMNMDQLVSSMPWNPFDQYTSFMPSFNTYNSAHQFEYGDALGYDGWAADAMNLKALECILCDIVSNLNIDNIFNDYGDFTYLFKEHNFDYNMDKGWMWKLGEETKCTAVITGIEHKICATESHDGKVLISFEKENDEAIRRLLGIMDVEDDDDDLQNEFDGVILDFDDDNVWDDVTQIEDEYDTISHRKCRVFQLAHFCVTHGGDDYIQFHVKVGTYKLHRMEAPDAVFSKVNTMLNSLWSAADVAYDNDYNAYEYEQDLEDIVDALEDEYAYEGDEVVADVLEEIADEIEEDIQDKIVEGYDEEIEEVLDEIADEVVDEIEEGQDVEDVLEAVVQEIDDEGDLEDVLEKIVDGVEDAVLKK